MTRAEALQKIRKCLALATSANEHEAAAALAKARELMEAYEVSDGDVELADVEETTARASRTMRPPAWESILCDTVRRALNVLVYLDERGDRVYVGVGPRAEIAGYAFTALFRRLKAARGEYIRKHLRRCKPGRKRQRADIFCQGWAVAVHRKIAALAPVGQSDPLLQRYMQERHSGLVTVKNRAAQLKGEIGWRDYSNGADAGRAVDLHAGVGANAVELLA